IAGGALDDDAARPQRAAPLGVANDGQRRAVLDRAAGIEELGLAEDLAAGRLGRRAQPDQRRAADGVDEALADVGHGSGPPSASRRARSVARWRASQCRAIRVKALSTAPASSRAIASSAGTTLARMSSCSSATPYRPPAAPASVRPQNRWIHSVVPPGLGMKRAIGSSTPIVSPASSAA